MKLFQELDEFMGWSDFYYGQKDYFNSLNESEQKFYLKKFFKKYELDYLDYYYFAFFRLIVIA